MLKKVILAASLLLPSMTWAGWDLGPYLGLGIGADSAVHNETAQISRPREFNVTNKTKLGAQGVLGDIYGGYGWHCNWFSLAGELNYNASSAKFHSLNVEHIRGTASSTTIRLNRSWGIGALPGIILPNCCALVYGRIGFVRGSFDLHTSDTSLRSANRTLSGSRFGIGMEKRVCNNLGLRFEYSHLSYHHHKMRTLDAVSEVTKKTRYYPSNNQFEVGLSYWFC